MKTSSIQTFMNMHDVFEYYDDLPDKVVIGEENKLRAERMQLYYLSYGLIQHKFKLPFYRKVSYRTVYPDENDLGKNLINILKRMDWEINYQKDGIFFEHNTHCPQVVTILQIASAALSEKGAEVGNVGFVPPLPFSPDEYKFMMGPEVDVASKVLNALAMTMRKVLLSSGMRETVKSYRRNATERYEQMMRVAEQRWGVHCKNLLIRLDWGYRKKYPAVRMRFTDQKEFEDLLLEVDGYRKEMLTILRRIFCKDLSFYVWKIECGDMKGIHIHWLIAVNGSKHQDRINVARHIADQWDANIGGGNTYTFNVNALPHAEASGLRVIDYKDPALYKIIGRYCDYLTKVDYTLKLRMPKGMRSLGCSKLLTTTKIKPGPKRKFRLIKQKYSEVRGPQGGSPIHQLNEVRTK